jgi:hypothetical protein
MSLRGHRRGGRGFCLPAPVPQTQVGAEKTRSQLALVGQARGKCLKMETNLNLPSVRGVGPSIFLFHFMNPAKRPSVLTCDLLR